MRTAHCAGFLRQRQRGWSSAGARAWLTTNRCLCCGAADPEAELIVKAQIHAGGRGKGLFSDGETRGVHICST